MAANITRTIITSKAYGLVISFNDEGFPTVAKTEEVTFLSTNPTDTEAARALREAGIKVDKKFIRHEIVKTEVYAMTLDEFIAAAHIVERGKGGYIRKSQLVDSEPEPVTE